MRRVCTWGVGQSLLQLLLGAEIDEPRARKTVRFEIEPGPDAHDLLDGLETDLVLLSAPPNSSVFEDRILYDVVIKLEESPRLIANMGADETSLRHCVVPFIFRPTRVTDMAVSSRVPLNPILLSQSGRTRPDGPT